MTTEERKARLRVIFETPVDRSLSEIRREIDEIMGRGVASHELALPQLLYDELDGKPVPGSLEKLLIVRGGTSPSEGRKIITIVVPSHPDSSEDDEMRREKMRRLWVRQPREE